jgi:D-lyxose ketol-isomerase
MIQEMGQITPMHFHWNKTEDIINRGGGELWIQLFNSAKDGELAHSDIQFSSDGVRKEVKSGATVCLSPGESITLRPGCYHKFWAEKEAVLVGEVSSVNDDETDNRFLNPAGRFPEIEEDKAPVRLLVTDYQRYYRPG